MDKKGEVWRKVDGQAIRCTNCPMDSTKILTEVNNPVGIEHHCDAENEICIFMKKKIDGQEWWDDFHDVYKTVKAEREQAILYTSETADKEDGDGQ